MGDRIKLHAAPTTLATVVAVAGVAALALLDGAPSDHARSDDRALPAAVSYTPRGTRLTPADWVTVKNAVRLREMALARRRSAYYRAFAAYMGLTGLTRLHPIGHGRCAIAISYLYDNLLDLAHAYAGEDFRPLRRLIRKQPSLSVCAPRLAPHVTYVS